MKISLSILVSLALIGCAGSPEPARLEPTYYPPEPDPPRVQYLTHFSSSTDIEQGPSAFDRFLFGTDAVKAAVQGPWGVAFRDGRIHVCDLLQRTVLLIDLEKKKFSYIRDQGRGKLRKPIQCEFDGEGNLYVADRERRQIVSYGPDYTYRHSYGPLNGKFLPLDVEVRGNEVFVCDIGNRAIQVFDRESREFVRSFGGGTGLNKPTNFAFDRRGFCHVVDSLRNRVIVFDLEGQRVGEIGEPGDLVGQFGRAKGIDIAPDDHVYVVDSGSEVCQIFTPEGEIAMFFGGPGRRPGNLYLPTDVFVTTEGIEYFKPYIAPGFEVEHLIFIVSQYGPFRITVYGFGKSSEYQYD